MNPPNQFAAAYLQETAEQLALIEEIILELEAKPDDAEAINRLFRIFHTIKGSGSMFGFDAVAQFTHHVETLLDCVRSGKVGVNKELVDVVLASKDLITTLLQGGEDVPEAEKKQLIVRLNSLLPGAGTPPPMNNPAQTASPHETAVATAGGSHVFQIHFQPEPAILARGVDPVTLLADLRKLGTCVVKANTDAVTPLEQFSPDICGFIWDITLTTDRDINAVKDVFIFVEEESKLEIKLVEPQAQSSIPSPASTEPPALKSPVTASTVSEPANAALKKRAVSEKQKAKAEPVVKGANSKMGGIDESIRVPAHRLDSLVNLVGELVINQSRLAQIANRLNEPGLSAPAEDLERLVGELRDVVLGIRMMPIGGTFNRFKRLVRDLSDELGKEIDLVTSGEDTELDKTVIDHLGDPLVHLIRNSIDHGISRPEERLKEGKPRRGTLRLSARYEGANVIIAIEDDGRGLDRDAIRAKAIEKNLISPDKQLTESELFGLILLPGFSTAKTITNVSGRGVGMDVVKRQIDALRGTVTITSQAGQGTCISLTLPLTLAIIDGLLVGVNQEQFIIPMSSVLENVELSASQRNTSNGRNILAVRGELISYLRLRDIFNISGGEQDLERVVIVNVGESRLGLVVDRVLGTHQTVIQSLGKFYRDVEVFSGATIMGDGRVALILDLPGLLHYTSKENP